MRTASLVLLLGALGACGDGHGTDPGDGSHTLLVNGRVEFGDGGAGLHVSVQRVGVGVDDAVVTLDSDFGTLSVPRTGGGAYDVRQAGWSGWYSLHVASGPDWLDGTIEAPDPAMVTDPDPRVAFDPHLDAVVRVRWGGDHAQTVRVKTKDFESAEVPDDGGFDVPATAFVEPSQEIEVRRRNETGLAGGAPGSSLSASIETKTTVLVVNPY